MKIITQKFFLPFFLFLSVGWCVAQTSGITSGSIYTLKSKSCGKLLSVSNSTLSNNGNVDTWTNTNSDSQRWIVTYVGSNLYTLANVGSEKLLHIANSVPGNDVNVNQYENTNDKTVLWKIVDQGSGYFSLQTAANNSFALDLIAGNSDDGANVALYTANNSNPQSWLFEKKNAQNVAPTAEIRDEVFQSWQNKYYKQASSGYVLGGSGFWGVAESMEVLLDAYETTGHSKYKDMFNNVYDNFYATQGDRNGNWMSNEFNDDIAWMVIACTRAYLLFRTDKYLTIAKSHFDQMYARAYLSDIGLLRWKENNGNGTTSCVNGPSEVAACYLAIATGDNSYYTKAKNLYANQRTYLYEAKNGKVWDTHSSNWSSTYNQGTYLGAAVMLYNYYGDTMYFEDAKKIAQFSKANLCNSDGVINVETGGADLPGFKGILMRYLRRFIVDMKQVDYIQWMKTNAKVTYNNRNSEGIIWTAWADKSRESTDYDAFGTSTAVSLFVNCPLNSDLIVKDAYSRIEAENFDYISGSIAETCTADGGGENLGGNRDGNYVGYMNVDFGTHVTSTAEFRVSNSSNAGNIEIRVGSPKGTLIGTASIPPGSGWGAYTTVTCNVSSLLGLNNIYLVFKGTNNFANLNYFKFNVESAFCPDVTDNGGELTSSCVTTVAGEDLSSLIDNKVNTKLYSFVGVNPDAIWFQYKSTVPIALKGYSLASANDEEARDPKSWKLQASNNGSQWVDLDTQTNQVFDKRWLLKNYSITTSTLYTYFRLSITARRGEGTVADFQLGEWQLYGTGLMSTDITNDGGVLSSQYVGNAPNETIGKLTDDLFTSKYLVKDQKSLWVLYKGIYRYKLKSYSLTSADDEPSRDVKSWTLSGSNDSLNWTIIDQRKSQFFPYRYSTQSFSCSPEIGYQFFKLSITDNNGAAMTQLGELQLIGDIYMDPDYRDITDNGGVLTASQDGMDGTKVENILDENGNTVFAANTSSAVWLQYKTPIATKLYNYSLSIADDYASNPKSWKLQGSNDGISWDDIDTRSNIAFNVYYLKKTFSVSTNSKYNLFRLLITGTYDSKSTNVQIAEWELFGSAITTDITDDGGTLTAQYEGNTNETAVSLTDNSETTKHCVPDHTSIWIQYKDTRSVALSSYSLTSANDSPQRDYQSWNLYASTNGTNWDLIDTQVNQIFPYRYCTQFYTCKTDKKYTYFKLDVLKNNGDVTIQMAEWQLFGNYGNYYPDITATGGTLSSSHAASNSAEGLNNLIDNKEFTKYYSSVGTTMPTVWIQYQSPIPSILKSYAITSANDAQNRDPKSWKLQASNNGTTWTDLDVQSNITFSNRYDQKIYQVVTTTTYTYFRLLVSARYSNEDSGFQLGEWELYGTAIANSDITDNGGKLTGQYVGSTTSNELIDKLTDNNQFTKFLVDESSYLWVQYKSTVKVKPASYSITSANDEYTKDPKAWSFYGSNTGDNWTLLDSQNNQQFAVCYSTQTYACTTDSSYSYFKLDVTSNNGSNQIQMAEWQLFGSVNTSDDLHNDVENPINVDSLSLDGVTIYPNPVVNVLNLNGIDESLNVDFAVYNVMGMPILCGCLNNRQIDLHVLKPGVYQLVLTTKDAKLVRQFIKIK